MTYSTAHAHPRPPPSRPPPAPFYPPTLTITPTTHPPDLRSRAKERLLGNADDPARRPGAGIPGLLALLGVALAEVVGAGVDDDGALFQHQESGLLGGLRWEKGVRGLGEGETYAQDALRADQLDQGVGVGAFGAALAVGLDVAEVADVAFGVGGGAVGFGEGVDWWVRRMDGQRKRLYGFHCTSIRMGVCGGVEGQGGDLQ